MDVNEMDRRLQDYAKEKERSWGRIATILKRQFDAWACAKLLCPENEDFKMAYLPVLFNIGKDGITNKELAAKAGVTKQAMNKVVKELTRMGYIGCDEHCGDGRCVLLFLTLKGKQFAIRCTEEVRILEKRYEDLLGQEKYEKLKDVLLEVIAFNSEAKCR